MKDEIAAAVFFLARLINVKRSFTSEQMAEFSENLVACLIEKFRNHWYEETPSKGQAFRCIRIAHDEPRDIVLVRAAKKSGLDFDKMNLPADFTLWVDPLEVVCRFGEKGTICPIASFPKKSSPLQVNDNETTTTTLQTGDANGNMDLNANPKSVLDNITEVLQRNSSTVANDNVGGVVTTHYRGRRNRTKYNLVRNTMNSEQDWPALSHHKYRWVSKTLTAQA
ncbi:maternal B9.15 protein-like [Acanthaster planci]|uniref:Maternal B9.15 protein-like n=1 Tax=Acanthaster planci TaxID=133434 RepID=A0A8B8A079_ACAPL|nr:maternal B9.15 protein-like [Acanthaster planci]